MQQELIRTAGTVVSEVAKNTTCTISLSGWPATFAIIGGGVVLGATVIGVVYICSSSSKKDPA